METTGHLEKTVRVEALREENARLSRRAKRLSGPGDAQALEKAAREKLGYLRGDEVLFKFE